MRDTKYTYRLLPPLQLRDRAATLLNNDAHIVADVDGMHNTIPHAHPVNEG